MTAPLIGVTTGRKESRGGYPLITVVEAYVQGVARAGAAPVLIPLGLSAEILLAILPRLDGILFTGGEDMAPQRYGNEPHPAVQDSDEDRDRVELTLFNEAVRLQKPFLGICRGLQLINVGLGGSLYEDIASQHTGALRHRYWPGHPRDFLAHSVDVLPDSRLAGILETTSSPVNSLHHQAIHRLAAPLKAVAFAPDGIVEAVEMIDYPFGLAVQWHPEWLPEDPAMQRLFRALSSAAGGC